MVAVVDLLLAVEPGVALVAVAPVLVRGARVVLRDASAADAGLLGAGLYLKILAVLALVLGRTEAVVVTGDDGLGAGASVQTRFILALVLVQVTQPASPAGGAGAGVVAHPVLALPVLTSVLQTLVNVHCTQGPVIAGGAAALKLLGGV